MLNKKKTKAIFHSHNIQVNTEALNLLDSKVKEMVNKWAKNCKNGNIKRLTPNLMWVAEGYY